MNSNFKYLLQFNLAMLFASTSGTFGRLIDLPPSLTIWSRCLFASIALFVFIKILKFPLLIHRQHYGAILVSSVLLGIHWVSYFYSLQISNVAIAMLSLFTYPVFTTLLEPIVLKTKFQPANLFLAMIVLVGIYFMVPEFDMDNKYTLGIIVGLFSSIFYSFRNLILKKHIEQYSGATLMFYQLAINTIILAPALFFFNLEAYNKNFHYILLLAIVTTAIGHTMFVMSFKRFSISAVSIMSSLQPLLGILIAFIILNEVPAFSTFIGGGLILATVIIESIRTMSRN